LTDLCSGIVLEPLDQRFELFQFLVPFSWWFHFHTHNVFGEMSLKQ
jgi:hypothetical protein